MVFTGTFGSQFVVAETARCGGGVAGTFQVSGYRPDAESAVFIDKKKIIIIRERTHKCALST